MRHRSQFCLRSLVSVFALALILLAISPRQALAWDWWRRLFESPPPADVARGGSRGDSFCLIAPESRGVVLGDRPSLVWQGQVARIELLDAKDKSIWEQAVAAVDPVPSKIAGMETYQVTADRSLESGQTYRWRIHEGASEPFTIPFRVLPASERASLNLPSAPAMRRADALAAAHLWADFWREVLSIQPPTAELEDLTDNSFARLCPLLVYSGLRLWWRVMIFSLLLRFWIQRRTFYRQKMERMIHRSMQRFRRG
jgi:hypothetical protein